MAMDVVRRIMGEVEVEYHSVFKGWGMGFGEVRERRLMLQPRPAQPVEKDW